MQRIRSRLSDSLLMPEVRERTQHETERHASPQALLAFARIPPFTQVLLLMLMPPTARRLPVPAIPSPPLFPPRPVVISQIKNGPHGFTKHPIELNEI